MQMEQFLGDPDNLGMIQLRTPLQLDVGRCPKIGKMRCQLKRACHLTMHLLKDLDS